MGLLPEASTAKRYRYYEMGYPFAWDWYLEIRREFMKKKTLEKQIRQVGFWTFIGIFSYMVMAFFLKSNYPIYEYDFNRSVAYDVIKDALTLGAAFLAPVAAFVLLVIGGVNTK